jgi:hypothetical protein
MVSQGGKICGALTDVARLFPGKSFSIYGTCTSKTTQATFQCNLEMA